MKELTEEEKANSTDYIFCYSCEEFIHGDELDWYNDIPICPDCESKLEL